MEALRIITEEHQNLWRIAITLDQVADEVDAGAKVDPAFFGSIFDYIEQFMDGCHHAKEDSYLFARLRERSAEALPIIERLEAEHREGDARMATLRAALEAYRREGESGLAGFQGALKTYIEHEWQHMNTEEHLIFPLARKHLSAEDWAHIDAAFLANDNPWQGPAGKYAALFTRIVNTAPAPVGLGG